MNASVIVRADYFEKNTLYSYLVFYIFYIFAAEKKCEPMKSPTGAAEKDCNLLNRNIAQRKIVVSN